MNDSIKPPVSTVKPSQETPSDPNTHLNQWLTDNNYEITVEALTEHNPFLEGKGFVLTDKPLLVVTVKRKENNAI